MPVHFSTRTSWDTSESALARAIRERRTAGFELLDLTLSNPTLCGFTYDDGAILNALRDARSITYDPDPMGILSARHAVAAYYRDHAATLSPANILLTTSTSEAYSFLFRLLCDPGDTVLVAQPSYPLFDFLADLDDVHLEPYPLFEDFGWWIDFAELERRITPRTRALVLVHPNNPTGHATTAAERLRLQQICLCHGLALIVDEVFLDFGLSAPIQSFATADHSCLTFIVSGLSKVAALPQMKVGWLTVFGPPDECRQALSRLEVVADTFLSMNAPAQLALPAWLAGREAIQLQILQRVRENLATLADALWQTIPVDAGWSAIVKLPQSLGSDSLAERLLDEAGLIVHPGTFYGIPQTNYIVVSLLGPPQAFAQGIEKLKLWCEPEKFNPRRTRIKSFMKQIL